MKAYNDLIQSLNTLSISIETYNTHTMIELVQKALNKNILSISFGIEDVYPEGDEVIIDLPNFLSCTTESDLIRDDRQELNNLRIAIRGSDVRVVEL